MLEKVRGVNTVWVPSFECDDDVQMNTSIQDLADCVLIDKESALAFAESLMEEYKDEWKDICEVSPHLVFGDVEEFECTWYGWEFIWNDLRCAMYLHEIPTYGMKNAD